MTISNLATRQFDVHGIVKIRITGHGGVVPAWLENFETCINAEPDITVAFVDKLPDMTSAVRFIDLHRYGYCDAGVVLFTRDASPKKILIPLEHVGQVSLTVYCEAGAKSLSILEELAHLVALTKGVVPLHASAFQYGSLTILASGFPNGGKTSLLLAFLAHGAKFISDDWAYLTHDSHVYGIPLPITVRAWQMAQLPMLQEKVQGSTRLKQQLMQGISRLVVETPPKSRLRRIRGKAAHFFESRTDTNISAAQLIDATEFVTRGVVDVILLAVAHDNDSIAVEAVSPQLALVQLVEMQIFEWSNFLHLYSAYASSVPEKYNAVLHSLKERLTESLQHHLESAAVYRVYHPHPVRLEDLFEHVQAEIDYQDRK